MYYYVDTNNNYLKVSKPLTDEELEQEGWQVITKEDFDLHLNTITFKPKKINFEIIKLKEELCATDYKLFKFLEGKMSAEEYAPIGEHRQALRDRINELEELDKQEEEGDK